MKTFSAACHASLSVLILPLVFGTPVRANDDAGAATRFEEADTNHDGRISREEFQAGVKNKRNWWPAGQVKPNTGQNSATPDMFTTLDVNRDGYLSREEIENGRPLRENRGANASGASTANRPPPDARARARSTEKTPDKQTR